MNPPATPGATAWLVGAFLTSLIAVAGLLLLLMVPRHLPQPTASPTLLPAGRPTEGSSGVEARLAEGLPTPGRVP